MAEAEVTPLPLLAVLVIALAGCGTADPPATPRPTPTPAPTALPTHTFTALDWAIAKARQQAILNLGTVRSLWPKCAASKCLPSTGQAPHPRGSEPRTSASLLHPFSYQPASPQPRYHLHFPPHLELNTSQPVRKVMSHLEPEPKVPSESLVRN